MMQPAEEIISDTTGLSSFSSPPSYFCRQKQDNMLKTTAA